MGAVGDGSESSDGRVGNGEHEARSSLGDGGGPRKVGVGEREEATALSVPGQRIGSGVGLNKATTTKIGAFCGLWSVNASERIGVIIGYSSLSKG
ncbi:hypothetical protein [Oryza sativa Japonica Group]|uniref:Uncharacterized protein n=1 Tax=Oryza sativa subsp. japonica TaxID=39947 RepID=Q5N7E3_ORYSJ|nr:hypothetical protein [Oryza sativa Japonica Group]BAD82613.1 hypothetical protein [Oryza sativa Japonica Group]